MNTGKVLIYPCILGIHHALNAVNDVFPKCTNLLCSFHINKNVKAKCKSLITQKNA